jgi:hypothetical protein
MALVFCPECVHLFEEGSHTEVRCPICDGTDQIRDLANPAIRTVQAWPWFSVFMAFLAGVIAGACIVGAFRL